MRKPKETRFVALSVLKAVLSIARGENATTEELRTPLCHC